MTQVAEPRTINRVLSLTGVDFVEGDAAHPLPAAAPLPLRGKVALVTGGSHGIGRSVAIDLAQRGAAVAVNYHSSVHVAATVCEVISSFGAQAHSLPGDVGDEAACTRMVEQVFVECGQVDILIHNAGRRDDIPFHLMHRKQWDDLMRVHLGGAYNLVRALINPMRQRGFGRVIFLTESPSRHTARGYANLAAGKSALAGLARSLAVENARRGITVNCVCPGMIETRRLQGLSTRDREKLESLVPEGRIGRPEEVAHLVSFLVSEQAAYITGQEIHIDGGLSL
ncbi:MAG: SDR family oxidoreductase [candidate division Zixibacteria bacterium]|nr:SDR family oxidoreductase [candidate division Zixibacteria bacterium]